MKAIFKAPLEDGSICVGLNGQPTDEQVAVVMTPQDLLAEDATGRRLGMERADAYWYKDGEFAPRPSALIQATIDTEAAKVELREGLKALDNLFIEKCKRPVETIYGVFHGGEASAAAINGAIALEPFSTTDGVYLTGIDKKKKLYTVEDALIIAATIGLKAEEYFLEMQDAKVALMEPKEDWVEPTEG